MAVCRTIRGKVSFSGVTYVALRSQKHNNSSAYSHQEDMNRVINLFPDAFMINGRVKPVIIKGLWTVLLIQSYCHTVRAGPLGACSLDNGPLFVGKCEIIINWIFSVYSEEPIDR